MFIQVSKCIALLHQVFKVIEKLCPVPRQVGDLPPTLTKTLYFPLHVVANVASLWEQEQSPEQVVELHFQRDLETKLCTTERVRGELVEEAYQRLLVSHPLYSGLNVDTVMTSIRGSMEHLATSGLVSEEDPLAKERVYAVLIPDQPNLTSHQKQILQVGTLDSKLAAIYDPRGEGGVEHEDREVAITSQQWCQNRLANVRRDGPMDQAGLVLAFALQHSTQRIHSARDHGEAGLVDRVGTSAYYGRLRANLVALGRWQGPPMFYISVSSNTGSELMLANAVSHTAGVKGKEEKVWHRGSEQQLLTPRPGREQEDAGLQSSYFVHCRSAQEEDSCPFHAFCSRRPLEEWREW